MEKGVVLLTGGTGLIGSEIASILADNGFVVHVLTRNPKESRKKNINYFHWDTEKMKIDEQCFHNVNYLMHLAGATIAKRWTKEYKQTIINSRVKTANFLLEEIKSRNIKLSAYVGASASGYYLPNTGETLTEEDENGNGFLAEVCQQWENAHQQFSAIASRVVIHRIGFVLSKEGGAMEKIVPSFRVNMAPHFGNGEQCYPCVHVEDVANQFVFSVVNKKLSGVYNASTEVVSQKQLNYAIAEALNKSCLHFSVPTPVLKLGLGEMRHLLIDSYNMSGQKVKNLGFQPKYATVKDALQHLFD